jgi:hypothetical protein
MHATCVRALSFAAFSSNFRASDRVLTAFLWFGWFCCRGFLCCCGVLSESDNARWHQASGSLLQVNAGCLCFLLSNALAVGYHQSLASWHSSTLLRFCQRLVFEP